MPSNLSHRGRVTATVSPRRNRDNFLRRVGLHSPEMLAAYRSRRPLSPLSLALRLGLLEFQLMQAATGTILPNDAFTDAIGGEEFTNPGVVDGVGSIFTFTGDNPDSWVIGGEVGNDPEISEVAAGEAHADSPTLGGGHVNIFSSVNIVVMTEIVAAIGDTYRSVVDVDNVVTGAIRRCKAGGGEIPPLTDIDSAGLTSLEFIADGTSIGLKRATGAGDDLTIAGHSAKLLSQRDIAVAGTVEMGVAGLQGQRAGALGADVVVNGDFDTDSDWIKGTGWTISGGTATHGTGSGSSLSQSSILTSGQSYHVTFDVIGRTAGSLQAKLGSTTLLTVDADGSYVIDSPADNINLIFFAVSAFDGSIDNVVVKPYSTAGAVYLEGVTADLQSKGTTLDGLTNMSLVLQLYGFDLTSKTLLEKRG